MLDSSFDPVVKQLSREYAEGVEKKRKLEDQLQERDLSENQERELKTQIHDLDREIMDKQEKLRSRL